MDFMLKIAGLVIVAVLFVTVLRRYVPEHSLLLSLTVVLAMLAMVGESIQSAVGITQKLSSLADISPNQLTPLLKVLGITVLTKLTTDFCKDSGSTSLASVTELIGNVMAILASLPLLESMIQLISSI